MRKSGWVLLIAGALDVSAAGLGFALAKTDANLVGPFLASVALTVGLLLAGTRWIKALYVFIALAVIRAVAQLIPPIDALRVLVTAGSGGGSLARVVVRSCRQR